VTEKYHDKAIRLVFDIVQSYDYCPDDFSISDVTVVWFCKTLQNWKAMVITHLPDRLYYEVTYDGDKQQAYVDTYSKIDNVVVPDTVENHITINFPVGHHRANAALIMDCQTNVR
jgi:hypothetical protein